MNQVHQFAIFAGQLAADLKKGLLEPLRGPIGNGGRRTVGIHDFGMNPVAIELGHNDERRDARPDKSQRNQQQRNTDADDQRRILSHPLQRRPIATCRKRIEPGGGMPLKPGEYASEGPKRIAQWCQHRNHGQRGGAERPAQWPGLSLHDGVDLTYPTLLLGFVCQVTRQNENALEQ